MAMLMSWLMRREVILPLLSLLCLTAPLSWPVYSTCLLLLSLTVNCSAHVVFRRYQLSSPQAGPHTVVNTLMYLLSVILQANEIHFEFILLLRLLWREGSLYLYQTQPLFFCLLLSPRFATLSLNTSTTF